MKNISSGRSMVEFIGILAVSAMMISLAVILGSKITNQTKRNLTYNTVKELAVEVKTHFWGKPNFNDLGQSGAEGYAKLVNDGFDVNTLKDGWNNKLEILGIRETNSFTIKVINLKTNDCNFLKLKFEQDKTKVTSEGKDGECSVLVQFNG